MIETLRPATLGEILDRTAQLYRRNFLLFAGVAALPVGTILAISLIVGALFGAGAVAFHTTGLSNPFIVVIAIVAALVAVPVYMAAAVFSYAGLTFAAASAHRGEAFTIRTALAAVKPRFWRYLGFLILQGIMIALIPGVIAGAIIGLLIYLIPGAGAAGGVALGFFAFLVGGGAFGVMVWRALGYSISLPVCVVEQMPAWASLQRGWKLSEGTRGRILVMYLLVAALTVAVSMVAAIPFFIILAVSTASGNAAANSSAFVVAEIVRVIVDFVLQVLLAPISAIALVLFYYDQRIRKEGFDIEWMMQQAGLTQPAPAPPLAEASNISAPLAPPDTVPLARPDTVKEQ
jgi:hypothetical protein